MSIVGTLVISKCGHDKGECYVISAIIDDKHVFVANGENRQVAKAKRKNIRHLSITKSRVAAIDDLGIKGAIKTFKRGNG